MSRTIVVTGGSMGIGRAVVERCLQSGANVFFCARGEEKLAAALEELQNEHAGSVAAEAADVSAGQDVARVFASAQARFGRIHAVIHAAAVLGPIGPITGLDPQEWLRTIEIDLFGTFLVTREACKHMTGAGGRIVLFSGGGASGPLPNYSAYACSKVGVVRFAETVAQEMLPFGIEINCLAPGFVSTRMHEATIAAGPDKSGEAYFERTKREIEGGGASPKVAADAAFFLASEEAAGITGKFVSAVYDDWASWVSHAQELRDTEIFTLRRVLPKERGMNWQ